jgi:AraC-like DNA-binding protein
MFSASVRRRALVVRISNRMPDSWRFTTDGFPAYQREQVWRDTLADLAVPVMTVHRPEDFHGTLSHIVSPAGVEFARLVASPQVLGGKCESPRHAVWLGLLLEGAAQLSNGTESFAIVPGDIVYSPTGVYSDLRLETEFLLLIAQFPTAMLSTRLLAPLALKVGHLPGRNGIGGVFSGMLRSLAETIDSIEREQMRSVESALLDFLIASVAADASTLALDDTAGERVALLHRIWQAIESDLGDPNLSAMQVAEASGMSCAVLKTLFVSAGRSFDSYVSLRRIERSRADFENPLYAKLSISDIWVRRGFGSAGAFSRAFRNQYGCTPREYRKERQAIATADTASPDFHRHAPSAGGPLFTAMAEH